jgi:hypothetical protein
MTVEWPSNCVSKLWFYAHKNAAKKWKRSAPSSPLCVRRVREIPVKKNPSFARHEQKAVEKEIVLTQKRLVLERERFAKKTMRLEEVNKN